MTKITLFVTSLLSLVSSSAYAQLVKCQVEVDSASPVRPSADIIYQDDEVFLGQNIYMTTFDSFDVIHYLDPKAPQNLVVLFGKTAHQANNSDEPIESDFILRAKRFLLDPVSSKVYDWTSVTVKSMNAVKPGESFGLPVTEKLGGGVNAIVCFFDI